MLRRFLIVLGALVAVSWAGAVPASAGGPTSALLVAPQTGMTSSLYYKQPEYERLSSLVRGTPSVDDADAMADHYRGPGVRITWLIHDVTVWRTDEIYVEADGGPWVATREFDDRGALPDKPVWHRSDDPAGLIRLLGSMKLLDPQAVPSIIAEISVPTPAPAAASTESPSQESGVSWVSLSGWRWMVPGLLLGIGLAWGIGRAQRRTGEPRWELIDETPRT